MVFELNQLRAQVTRRTLGLLLLCGLVPAIGIGVFAYRAMSARLVQNAGDQLVQESQVYATRLNHRLQDFTAMLKGPIDSVLLSHGRAGHPSVDPEPRAHFEAVVLETAPDRIARALGVMPARPTLTEAQESQLRAGRSVLIMGEDRGAKAFFLVTPAKAGSEYPRTWGTALVPIALLELEPPSTGRQWCVFSDSTPIYCRAGRDSVRLTPGMQLASGTLRWRDRDAAYLTGYSRLEHVMIVDAAPWFVAVSDAEAGSLTPLTAFRSTVFLGLLLAALAISALSLLLVRRRVKPLVDLTTANARLLNGDFSARVVETSNVEFEALIESFNQMAGELDRQFTTLDALHRVDLAVLEGRTPKAISATVAHGVPTLLDATAVAVISAGNDDPLHWCGEVVGPDRAGPEQIDVMVTKAVFACLRMTPDWFVIAHGDPLPEYCAALKPEHGANVVVFPMLRSGRPFGVLAIAQQPGAVPHPRLISSGRQIANRLGQGLTDVARLEDMDALSTGALTALARSIDAASRWTTGHSERVALIAVEIARRVGLDEKSQTLLFRAALLHDIGKLGMPSAILDKRGQLTDDELCTIETHPVAGAEMMRPIAAFHDIVPLVQHHHELLDGSGYPHGLRAEKISPMVRVLTVADVYDALISDRPYREGLSPEGALGILRRGAGVKFDERVVAALETMIKAVTVAHDESTRAVPTFGDVEVSTLLADVQQAG